MYRLFNIEKKPCAALFFNLFPINADNLLIYAKIEMYMVQFLV